MPYQKYSIVLQKLELRSKALAANIPLIRKGVGFNPTGFPLIRKGVGFNPTGFPLIRKGVGFNPTGFPLIRKGVGFNPTGFPSGLDAIPARPAPSDLLQDLSGEFFAGSAGFQPAGSAEPTGPPRMAALPASSQASARWPSPRPGYPPAGSGHRARRPRPPPAPDLAGVFRPPRH